MVQLILLPIYIITTIFLASNSNGQDPVELDHTFTFQPHSDSQTAHELRAQKVILLDSQTIEIQGLSYDGQGPMAFWMVGFGYPPTEWPGKTPGYKIPSERKSCNKLRTYRGDTIRLTLPANYTIGGSKENSIEWLAIYCTKFHHNFGHVQIPKDVVLPEHDSRISLPKDCPDQELQPKSQSQIPNPDEQEGTEKHEVTLDRTFSFYPHGTGTVHGLKAERVTLKDKQTIEITKLFYDGKDAFWMVGYGEPPAEKPKKEPGFKIPNEHGKCSVLKAYNGDTIILTLPSDYTIGGSKNNSIEWLAMYCITFKHNFGHVVIPKDVILPEHGLDKSHNHLPLDCGQVRLNPHLFLLSGIFGLSILVQILN